MEDIIYKAFQIFFHNGLYATLILASCTVMITFAIIFFKNYKEYRAILSGMPQADKKATPVNIDTSPELSTPYSVETFDILAKLRELPDLSNERMAANILSMQETIKMLQANGENITNANAERQQNHEMISKMLKELHKDAIKKVA